MIARLAWVLLPLLLLVPLSRGAEEEAGDEVAEDAPAPAASNVPDRERTPREIERDVEVTRRELEELLERIGDADPNDKQREQLREILARLGALERELSEAEQRYDEALTEAKDFVARWMRLRQAFRDFTYYDLNNGQFRIDLGLRLQVDGTLVREDDGIAAAVGSIGNGLDVRRGRIFAKGRLFRRLDFSFEYDFAADSGLKDVYLEGSKFVRGFKWRIGHFKEPFSMSRQASGFDLPNLEWPLPVPAFAPGRNWGLMLRHQGSPRRLTWAVSMTTGGKVTDDNRVNSNFTFTGRVTGLPIYRAEGRRLLHLGGSVTRRAPSDNTTNVAARPEARFVPFLVGTGEIAGDRSRAFGLEAATVVDRLWAQSEWIEYRIDADVGGLTFEGGYVEAGWFLTGEHRFYRLEDGVFGRLTPNRLFHGGNPFTGKGDGGAIELTGRFSTIDLDSGPVGGGRARDFGVGLNWYLTQATRFMVDYVHSSVKDVGRANIVLVRFQFNP